MLTRINPSGLFDATSLGMSQGTVDETSGLIFLSGQVAWDEHRKVHGATYGEQTEYALRNLATALAAAGSSIEHVVHVRVYARGELADHMEEISPVLAEFFGTSIPAVTGIGVASLATQDTLVEIEVVARRTP